MSFDFVGLNDGIFSTALDGLVYGIGFWIIIGIVVYLFFVTIALLFIKLILRVPPIRHLCQSIFRDISGTH